MLILAVAGLFGSGVHVAHAQSLSEALGQAYQNNPQLNAARAQLRVTNENVPQALAGYRPRVTGTGDVGYQTQRVVTSRGVPTDTNLRPRGVGIQVDQTLFNGFQTDNQVRQAEALVRAQRETLRTTEQEVLLAAATAYMDVVRDQTTLEVRRRFVTVISEQLRQTQERLRVGEVTRTDVAQAESRLALARAQLAAAEAQLNLSRATYERIVGRRPGRLTGQTNVERLLPNEVMRARRIGAEEHPQIRAAVVNVDAAAFAVSIAEAGLYPTVTATGALTTGWERQTGVRRTDVASAVVRVSVPIYDGGVAPSRVRQARETVGQRRIDVDTVRDQIVALVQTAFGNLVSTRAQIAAQEAQIRANEIALQGVREEARVGQRTTLDVLNAEQDLLNSRLNLIQAQRDRTVAAYTLLGAIGRLNVTALGLRVPQYDMGLHYQQVRDRWHGLRTPSGE